MENINSADDLKAAILQLENKQKQQGELVKEQFTDTFDSLKPVNIIKNIFKEATASPELKGNILNTSLGLTAGFFAKKLFEKGSANPVRKILGSVLMFGITNVVTKHPDTIKSLGNKFWETIRYKSASKKRDIVQQENGQVHSESSYSDEG
jgi:hypothetical protein